jgi:ATP-dependent exoDNAse (exonuclease V) beta subunit
MTQNLKTFLTGAKSKDFATQKGLQMHAALQRVVVDDSGEFGDQELIDIIKNRPELKPFFVGLARTEVPIAGIVNGVFLSRRIDRLLINNNTKTIDFVDYKTDINKDEFVEKYKKQLKEYAVLLQSAYPGFKINGYILWIHDWTLDKIIK